MAIIQIVPPVPGILYLSPTPGAALFKQPGDAVAAGETVALVEVMKSFLPVEAEAAGTFVRYLVDNEANVEPDQAVCEIEG
ncbi:acetyl-CoA carboxylase biotin carboxyl carrier protein [Arboricoccus pini]|uniref:Biotin carboxyl carrier protein of acetyl-CoA carboxylase n=1 Tax=Arboricoccus pini TaxID=1963835 RepID=A0A212Q0R2_9PROT|nr:biotin/lipoyl-containing protein [Arboricoccus pini]SNB52814.1 acetyl-CoA carboxylase biotin carboxyl carrier protein [Arboricoccus pini]